MPLHRPRAYSMRPYEEIRTLRPLRTLREIFRFRIGPVATGPSSVIGAFIYEASTSDCYSAGRISAIFNSTLVLPFHWFSVKR